MPPAHCRIRFVGGPWHNQLGPVGTCTIISPRGLYRLAEFHTPHYRTTYYQYLHETLIYANHVARCSFQEKLPAWSINSRQLYFKLRRAMKCSTKSGQS